MNFAEVSSVEFIFFPLGWRRKYCVERWVVCYKCLPGASCDDFSSLKNVMFIDGFYIIFGKFNLKVGKFCSFIGQVVGPFISYYACVRGNMTESSLEGYIFCLQ